MNRRLGEQEKVINLMDEIYEAEATLESMHHISVLLMDACKGNKDEASGNVIYCYYTYTVVLKRIIKSCIDRLEFYMQGLEEESRIFEAGE